MNLVRPAPADHAPAPDWSPGRNASTRVADIEAAGLSVRYGNGPAVFEDVSFAVTAGEIVALVGSNGAGKSSLLKCCLGLMQPTLGTVRLFGSDLSSANAAAATPLRRRCGFVAQKHNLVGRMSVLSNVIHGLLGAHGGPLFWSQRLAPRMARRRAMAALENVDLAGFAERRADRLSGGQSQRVAIARALVSEPGILFADEPAASLDPAAGDEVMGVLSRLARDSGTTVLFTSHNLMHAVRFSDRVLALKDGALVLDRAARSTAELDDVYA